jgi:hypothetical protein
MRTPYSPFVLNEIAPEEWKLRTLRAGSPLSTAAGG